MLGIGTLSKQRRDGLLDICARLLDEVSTSSPDKPTIGKLILEFKANTGLDNSRLAELFDVSVQTLYRWMKSDGSIPRKGHITHVMDVLSSEVARPIMDEPQEVIIGVSKFWDMALITGFELAFAAYNITPKFYALDSWHEDAHEAFVHKDIEIAVHNHFTQLYDERHPRKLDLELRYPLFSYQGHHIFANQDYLSRFSENPIASALSSGRLDGLKPAVDQNHKSLLGKLLDDAQIGVERGTDLELAFRRAFSLAGMRFPDISSGKINCKKGGEPLNGPNENPYLITSEEALDAFKRKDVDMFCGGWQQFYELQGAHTPVLLAPFELNVKSFNGLVATKQFAEANDALLQSIAQVWFCGITRFRKWGVNPKGLDEGERLQAIAELRAILAASERYTEPRKDFFAETNLPSSLVAAIKSKLDSNAPGEITEELIREVLAEKGEQVLEWAELLCKYDAFYPSLLEARSAFSEWWADEQVQQLWADTKMDQVRGVHYVS